MRQSRVTHVIWRAVPLTALLAALGCNYRYVAPPPTPAPTMPVIDELPARPPAEGMSRILLEATSEQATVYRQIEMAQPAERSPTSSRNKAAPYDRYELLCVTPCAADVRRGAHILHFESLTDADRRSEALVVAPRETTVVRHSIGRTEQTSAGYAIFGFTAVSAALLGTFGAVGAIGAAASDGELEDDGKRYNADGAVTGGLIVLAIAGVLGGISAVGLILSRPDYQPGSTVQFVAPKTE